MKGAELAAVDDDDGEKSDAGEEQDACAGGWTTAWEPLSLFRAAATVPELAAATRPVSVSRFRRNSSERMSDACYNAALRRNRRTPRTGLHRVESPGQLGKHFVYHGPDGAQRMIVPYPPFRRQITEHVTLLMICSSHAFSYRSRLWIRSSFSAAC